MGIRLICSEGYILKSCRCRKEHFPVEVAPCPGVTATHSHGSTRVKPRTQGVVCPRCEEEVGSLVGDICAPCADDLRDAGDVA